MSYVIYEYATTKIFGGQSKSYKTFGAAKAAVTRMRKKMPAADVGTERDPEFFYCIAETNHFFKHIEKTVERTNMMSGKTFRERVNTPYHCSPSSESYWSN